MDARAHVSDRDPRFGAGQLYAVALGAGAAAWLITALLGGRSEAWDSPWYWSAAYPLCIALAGVLGYLEPARPWRWALATMLVQPVAMILTADGSFGLLPLGLILFGVLALPAVLCARMGAWLRLRGR
ncbi:MAG TPA: hypothetical protein VFX89_03450 [Gammaproteobacteria bacterium]|nr:hypothetical protein [Gammaproteobacteria bacterium]